MAVHALVRAALCLALWGSTVVEGAVKLVAVPCDGPKSGSVISLSNVNVGMEKKQQVSLKLAGFAADDITEGTFKLAVTMAGVELIKKEGDVCSDLGSVFKCPIKKGEVSLGQDFALPEGMSLSMLPPGKYKITLEAVDKAQKNLLCLAADADVVGDDKDDISVDVAKLQAGAGASSVEAAADSSSAGGKESKPAAEAASKPPPPTPPQQEKGGIEGQQGQMSEDAGGGGKGGGGKAYGDGLRDGFLKGQKDGFVEGYTAGYKSGFKDGNNSTLAEEMKEKVRPSVQAAQASVGSFAGLPDPVRDTAVSLAALSGAGADMPTAKWFGLSPELKAQQQQQLSLTPGML